MASIRHVPGRMDIELFRNNEVSTDMNEKQVFALKLMAVCALCLSTIVGLVFLIDRFVL